MGKKKDVLTESWGEMEKNTKNISLSADSKTVKKVVDW